MKKDVPDWMGALASASGMLLVLTGWLSGMSACYVAVREPVHEVVAPGEGSGEIVVEDAPPPSRSEVVIGAAPGPDYIWIGGYWGRYRNNWHWVGGRWVRRPHPDAVWIGGRWDRGSRGYFWRSGHWR